MSDIDPSVLDKRVMERYLKRGELADRDVEKHLKSLPDLAAEALPVEAQLDDEDYGDEDDGEA